MVNQFRKLLGVINRDYLHVLLKNRCFVNEHRNRDTFQMNNSARLSLNSSDNRTGSIRMKKLTMTKEERRKLIQSAIDVGQEDVDIDINDIKDTLPVTWENFNCKFNDVQPKYSEIEPYVQENVAKRLDLRPYMEQSPHFVSPRDNLQKVLDVFRLHHVRYLPVVENEQVVGIITRQDLFAYMTIK